MFLILGPEMKFVNIFSLTPLGHYISSKTISEQQDLFLSYQRDFILMSMTISSPKELKVRSAASIECKSLNVTPLITLHVCPVLQITEFALSTCIEELRMNESNEQLTLPWVHIGYNTFQQRLQNLNRILALSTSMIDSLEEKTDNLDPMIRGHMVSGGLIVVQFFGPQIDLKHVPECSV